MLAGGLPSDEEGGSVGLPKGSVLISSVFICGISRGLLVIVCPQTSISCLLCQFLMERKALLSSSSLTWEALAWVVRSRSLLRRLSGLASAAAPPGSGLYQHHLVEESLQGSGLWIALLCSQADPTRGDMGMFKVC